MAFYQQRHILIFLSCVLAVQVWLAYYGGQVATSRIMTVPMEQGALTSPVTGPWGFASSASKYSSRKLFPVKTPNSGN